MKETKNCKDYFYLKKKSISCFYLIFMFVRFSFFLYSLNGNKMQIFSFCTGNDTILMYVDLHDSASRVYINLKLKLKVTGFCLIE